MISRFVFALALLMFVGPATLAQQTRRDPAREQVFVNELEGIAPLAVEDFKAGTTAMDADRFEEAAQYFDAVRKRAPEFDPALRRLGYCLVSQGKIAEGIDHIQHALKIKRSPENLSSMAQALAYPTSNQEGTADQKEQAFALMIEADSLANTLNDPSYAGLLAQLALETGHEDVFRRTTAKLVTTHPELMIAHYFNAIVAADDEQWSKAEDEIRKAESLGLPSEAAAKFLGSGIHTRVLVWRYFGYALGLIALWIVGLVTLFLLGKLMSWKTLRSIENSNPNEVTTESDLRLRKLYRFLINFGGVYYYLSFPFVIVIVLGTAAGVTYASLMAGYVPIKLVLILGIGALITVYKMIRSLFIKIEKEDPGRVLTHAEAPGLWDLTKRVAETINTRPVDEIRVTPGTDLAVYERGSWRERSNDKAHRILILGVGLLNDFELNGFRAVLAHEYGHLSHRDTAGGDVALRVNQDMIKFAIAMVAGGQNVWWNLAFHFLRIYHFIFRRISHGATRLQEILADRVAAVKFGADAFEEGLRHVVCKSAEFEFLANREINESATARRALQNLYELPLSSNKDIEEKAEQALNRETTQDSTHPAPNERFRLTRMIVSQTEPPISGKVWDLFQDRAALTFEMTSAIQSLIGG